MEHNFYDMKGVRIPGGYRGGKTVEKRLAEIRRYVEKVPSNDKAKFGKYIPFINPKVIEFSNLPSGTKPDQLAQYIMDRCGVTMDMLDDMDKVTAVMLFSGDSDMCAPLERLRVKGKRIGVVGVRGKVARELHHIKDKYIDFGRFYTGKREYISENPAFGGTA